MEIAGRQMQEKSEASLWQWPTSWSNCGYSGGMPAKYTPKKNVWYGRIDARIGAFRPDTEAGSAFGPDFATSAYSAGYRMGVFLDLALNKQYVMTAVADKPCMLTFTQYHVEPNGICYVLDKLFPDVKTEEAGKIKIRFQMPDDYVLMTFQENSTASSTVVTLSQISIVED